MIIVQGIYGGNLTINGEVVSARFPDGSASNPAEKEELKKELDGLLDESGSHDHTPFLVTRRGRDLIRIHGKCNHVTLQIDEVLAALKWKP